MALEWIKQVDEMILALDQKPQFGQPVNFSWQDFETQLKAVFETDFSLLHQVKGWTDPTSLAEGIGKKLQVMEIQWTPLETPAYFVTTEKDLKKLMAQLLGGDESASYFYESREALAFYDYFSSEVLRVLQNMGFADPLTPRLSETYASLDENPIDEPCFIIDVSLSFGKGNLWGRILIPESLRNQWKKFFVQAAPSSLSEEMRDKIPLVAGLEIGKTTLKMEEWKSVRTGDFLMLDHCSFNPDTNRGGVLLTLNGKPIFRARYKDNQIKITNYPVYEEVSNMARDRGNEDEKDLYGDKELDEGEDLFEEFPEEEFREEKEEVEEKGISINPDELPLQLTVEIARLKLTAKELMNLSPGSLLDLHVSPEQGVDLVINGKKVGRGELIRLGEVLGVRILAL